MAKQAGDKIEIGDTVGHPQEMHERFGRVTGFIKGGRPFPVIIRKFQPGDGWFPTGSYVQTWLVVPYTGGKNAEG